MAIGDGTQKQAGTIYGALQRKESGSWCPNGCNSGEIDNKQYQKQLTPLKREKKEIAAALNRFAYQELDDMIPEHNIATEEIEQYLEETREWELWLRRFKQHPLSM